MSYRFLADVVLLAHFGVALFIVDGIALIVLGNRWRWQWVNERRFRSLHLAAMALVTVQACLGRVCPLTTLESWLRLRAHSPPYSKSFVAEWIHRILYYDIPPSCFRDRLYRAYDIGALGVATIPAA